MKPTGTQCICVGGKLKGCVLLKTVSHSAVWDLLEVSHQKELLTNHHALTKKVLLCTELLTLLLKSREITISQQEQLFSFSTLSFNNSYFVSQISKLGTNLWINCLLSMYHCTNMHIAKWPLWLNLDDHLRKNCQFHLIFLKSLSVHLRISVTLECYPRYMNN